MIEKLKKVEARYEQIGLQLMDPARSSIKSLCGSISP